jgi:hypothetical protein
MGVRQHTEASNLAKKRPYLSTNYRRTILYDGVSTADTGDQLNLAGNIIWIDATGLYRIGLNNGPTFMNNGVGAFALDGCQHPKEYATLINTDPGLVARINGDWEVIDSSIARGESVAVSKIYSLFRITFAAAGACHVMTL